LDGHQNLNYDFLGEGSHIESAYRQVVKKWLDTDANPDEAVLIDQSGTLMRGEIERLLRDRNDRPITLVE
jgi:hypothetical protein